MTDKDDWKTQKILRDADEALLKMAVDHSKRIRGELPEEPTPEPVPVPLDPTVENDAFKALLAALAETDDGDTDTAVDVLSLDEFDAETFTPATPPEEPAP